MPKDALTIYRGAEELNMLVGGRIDKVNMPSADTLILLFHTSGAGNHRLVMSCNPSLPRVHITTLSYKNPETASGTLMYFRKRLVGAVLTDIVRSETERMITFKLSALDELRERVHYELIAELTGKCANIVFVENGIIGNCLRRISAEVEGKRAVLPGLKYSLPNPTGRVGIFDGEALKAQIHACSGVSARTAVNKCVAGLAPATVDEIFFRLDIPDDAPPSDDVIDRFTAAAKEMYFGAMSPAVAFDNDKPLDFFVAPYLTCGGTVKSYPTLNAAMDAYYSSLFSASDFAAFTNPIRAAVKYPITKKNKRLAEATAKLEEAEAADSDRINGELITANIYRIKRGDTVLLADNWYDGTTATVKLDPLKNAQQNAAAYFKSYSKKKKAAVYAKEHIDAATSALYRLDGITAELELCTDKRELDEIKEELISMGLMRPDTKKKKVKPVPSEPYSFVIDGATLLVGKNHAQNDRITKGAAKTDTWLHVKDAHGSHAVLKTPSPTEAQLTRAAEIAAYYSQARGADKADVDYTLIKYVYPHGGGKVEYLNYKTLTVKPKA